MKHAAAYSIALVVILLLCAALVRHTDNSEGYIRGMYGRYCYPLGSQPSSIKNPMVFATKEACNSSLGK